MKRLPEKDKFVVISSRGNVIARTVGLRTTYRKRFANSGGLSICVTDLGGSFFTDGLTRLQGSCLKGDFCEFSHHIDVQEVASKIVQKPQSSAPVVKFDEKEYPDLGSSSQKQKPSSFSYYANPSSIKSEEEFPSLASAAKIRTPTTTQNNTPRINFAEAAKRKAGQQQQQKTINTTNKKNNKSRTMQQLRQPVKIPWLVTGSALNKQYLEQVM